MFLILLMILSKGKRTMVCVSLLKSIEPKPSTKHTKMVLHRGKG